MKAPLSAPNDTPLSSLGTQFGNLIANSVQLKPDIGLFTLAIALTLVAFLAYSRLLSSPSQIIQPSTLATPQITSKKALLIGITVAGIVLMIFAFVSAQNQRIREALRERQCENLYSDPNHFGVQMPTCPACTTTFTTGARFCVQCGQNLGSTGTSLIPARTSSVAPPPGYLTTAPPQFGMAVPPMVISVSTKNVGVAILLTILFGPLGMFYSTVGGAIVMCIVTLFVMVGTFGVGLLFTWPICIIWAAVAADSYNKQLVYGRYR